MLSEMKPKVLFYTKLNFGNEAHSGISKKIFAQAKALRRLDIETDLLYFRNNEVVISNGDYEQIFRYNNKWKRFFFQFFSFSTAIDLRQYTHIYIRHFFLNPFAILLLKKLKKANPSVKIVMEIASYPYHDQVRHDDVEDRIRYGLDKVLCTYLKKYVDRILTFSAFDRIFDIPTIKTSNGVDIDGLFPKKPTALSEEFHILGLANVQHWHGFDRIIAGMSSYHHQFPVYFHIVGKGDAISALKRQSVEAGLEKTVIFHGAKYGDELQAFFDTCHLGVSSLGMHRIGVANGETSNLKVREYCARGIPFINGYLDRDIPANFPFVFQVAADESPVNIEQTISFYRNLLLLYPDYPGNLHEFAKNNLTWEAKFKVLRQWILSS
ncbi:MAG: glycosyltransferase [Saprospiraceae bacterium]